MRTWLPVILGLGLGLGLAGSAAANTSVGDNQTVTIDCAKDSHVDIGGNDSTVTIVGDCYVIVIAGNRNKVVASTTNLGVSGSHNSATVTVVEHLFVLGDDNAVTWKPRDPKKAPEVSDGGKRNKVTRAK